MGKARGERRQACRSSVRVEPAPIFRIGTVAAETPSRLRLVRGRADAEPSPLGQSEVRVRCALCGPRERIETRRTPLSDGVTGVITCHQLDCGHAWHRTIASVGGIFPGLVRNATFIPCDCRDATPEGR